MKVIKETTLHPEGNDGVDLYPKTSINQVQELPQKLTTVENQVNQLNIGKLTKPTNPSAESAVTMLADGTVGTKPLSEIGGGKLYCHNIYVVAINNLRLDITLYKSDNSEINTIDKLFDALNNSPEIPCYYSGNEGVGFVQVSMTGEPGVHAMILFGVVANSSNQVNVVNISGVNATTIGDTVIEL